MSLSVAAIVALAVMTIASSAQVDQFGQSKESLVSTSPVTRHAFKISGTLLSCPLSAGISQIRGLCLRRDVLSRSLMSAMGRKQTLAGERRRSLVRLDCVGLSEGTRPHCPLMPP